MADRIAIVDLADELQVGKQWIFKLLKKLEIQATPRRESDRGGQNVATVTAAEAALIRDRLQQSRVRKSQLDGESGDEASVISDGVFYVIQLEPTFDPCRIKVGFTTDIEGRLRKHRCVAPLAQCVKTWPCRPLWERTAIDCVTVGCEQLHTEVFRAVSLSDVISRAEAFFSIMPPPGGNGVTDMGSTESE